MTADTATAFGPQLNLLLGWSGILLGFLSGLVLGLGFHHENWLGGYGSHRRRLYRLAHISLFGLGAVNLMFGLTVGRLNASGLMVAAASWAFVIGAVAMPICCVAMAHAPRIHALFAVPVVSLITGAVLMLVTVVRETGAGPTPSSPGAVTGQTIPGSGRSSADLRESLTHNLQ
jgi:hypothetical protein